MLPLIVCTYVVLVCFGTAAATSIRQPLRKIAPAAKPKRATCPKAVRYPVYPCTEEDLELLEALEQRNCLAAKQALFKGANPNITTKYDNTALHVATLFNYSDLAQILVNIKKTMVNALNQDGDTALYLAVLFERYTILKLLLGHPELAINLQHHADGETALHVAILKGDPHSITMLLQHPQIHCNAPDNFGNTPLHIAVRYEQLFAMQILLQRGADKTIKNKRGQTPRDLARSQGIIEALEGQK